VTIDHEGLIRRSYRAFQEVDEQTLRAVYHPEAVFDFSRYDGWPEDPVYKGRDGIIALMHFLSEVTEIAVSRPVEMVALDGERVFVHGEFRTRGKSSGIEVGAPPFGQIISFRDDLILCVEQYQQVDDARRAAGLET
jgi:ketosteroid isomerase-like protein